MKLNMPFHIDHFSLMAPLYDRYGGQMRADTVLELLRLPGKGRVLDAAGGTGRLAELLGGAQRQIVLADLSPRMLQSAKKKEGLQPVLAAAERLPFRAGSFERIAMVDAFHHLIDQEAAAAEMWRLLAPGGQVVIQEPRIEHWLAKAAAVFEKAALMRSHIMPAGRIAGLFAAYGAATQVFDDHFVETWIVAGKELTAEAER